MLLWFRNFLKTVTHFVKNIWRFWHVIVRFRNREWSQLVDRCNFLLFIFDLIQNRFYKYRHDFILCLNICYVSFRKIWEASSWHTYIICITEVFSSIIKCSHQNITDTWRLYYSSCSRHRDIRKRESKLKTKIADSDFCDCKEQIELYRMTTIMTTVKCLSCHIN